MKWIKASDRLPEKPGIENSVIVKLGRAVYYGFKNFDDKTPKMYIETDTKSYLTLDCEWLDESPTPAPINVQEDINVAARKAVKDRIKKQDIPESYHNLLTGVGFDMFLAGYAFKQTNANVQGAEELAKDYADRHSDSKWNKAAELERAFIAGSQSQENWHQQYADLLEWVVIILSPLQELVILKQLKDEHGKTPEYEERQPLAWERAREASRLWEEKGNIGHKVPASQKDVSGLVKILERINKIIIDGTDSNVPSARILTKIDFIVTEALTNYQSQAQKGEDQEADLSGFKQLAFEEGAPLRMVDNLVDYLRKQYTITKK